jgi:NADH:ubiquinone oxidoreductase subunit C
MSEEFDAFPLRKDFPLEGRARDHGYWRKADDERRYSYKPKRAES